jgi:acetyltransferase-like isoleucine patch superfamily enzyme
MSSALARLRHRLRKRPAPRALVAIYLSLRWKCQVSTKADIDFPANLRLGRRCRLHACRIIARGPIEIGDRSSIMDYVLLSTEDHQGRIIIGASMTIGPFSLIYGAGGVTIGDDGLIAPHTMVFSTDHISDDIHRAIGSQGVVRRPVQIDRDVWLGAHCTVLGGATIGVGSIVGANSVVKGVVPPRVVAAGAPARILRERTASDRRGPAMEAAG